MHLQFRKSGDVFNVENTNTQEAVALWGKIGLLKELYRLLRQGRRKLPWDQ
jgi:hypothetical protein